MMMLPVLLSGDLVAENLNIIVGVHDHMPVPAGHTRNRRPRMTEIVRIVGEHLIVIDARNASFLLQLRAC